MRSAEGINPYLRSQSLRPSAGKGNSIASVADGLLAAIRLYLTSWCILYVASAKPNRNESCQNVAANISLLSLIRAIPHIEFFLIRSAWL